MAELTTAEIDRLAAIYSQSSKGSSDAKQLVEAIVRISRTATGTEERRLPEGYLSLRAIEHSLARRMWAGIARAKVAKQVLCDETNKRSAGFAPRGACVAASLSAAFFAGKLTLYVVADEARFNERFKQVPSWAKEPTPVPKELLRHVFVQDSKGRLSGTIAIRPSRKLAGNDRLFALLNRGHLVVRESEFRRWVRLERCKRRWPSQKTAHASPKRNPVGRPSKRNGQLKAAIAKIAGEKAWNGDRPLTELHRLLSERDLDVPSVDTLGRMVDERFAEAGEPGLRRRRRVRRR